MCNFGWSGCDGKACDGECGAPLNNSSPGGNSEDSSLMDLFLGEGGTGIANNLIKKFSRGTGSAIIETFGPQVIRLVRKYPKLATLANLPIVFWFISKYVISNMEMVWKWLMSYALASVNIKQDDKIFHNNVKSWILTKAVFKERRALSAQSALDAKHQGTKIADGRRVVYEGESTFQFFKHKRCWFVYSEAGFGGTITIYTGAGRPNGSANYLTTLRVHRTRRKK